MADSNGCKVLVLFFSRSGTTRHLAESIARATHADVEELKERRSRKGILGWLRSGYEGTYRRSAETLPLEHQLRTYDLVFIGSPTWNRALSSPVRGFLQRYAAELPPAALFATCQGHGAEDVVQQMAELLPHPPLATLALTERDALQHPAVSVGELVEKALTARERAQQRA
jgi:flavodoxin